MRLTLMTTVVMLLSAQTNASVEQQLIQCAATADKLDRLICYDELAQSVKNITPAAVSSQTTTTLTAPTDATAANPPPVAKIENNFGMTAKPVQEKAVDKIYLEVQSVVEDPYGAIKVTFTNGQVWKQTDSRQYNLKKGETVYIEKAALGSFLMGTNDRNAKIRVKRLK